MKKLHALFNPGKENPPLGEIGLFFENHRCTKACPVFKFLENMNLGQLLVLLPILHFLPPCHQQIAMVGLKNGNFQENLLTEVIDFCSGQGSVSQVVVSTIEHLILAHKRLLIGDELLATFFKGILQKFHLPSPSATEEDDISLTRITREHLLDSIAGQIGTAIVTMPFPEESLKNTLCSYFQGAFEEGNLYGLHKKSAILGVLARGVQEKVFVLPESNTAGFASGSSIVAYLQDIRDLIKREPMVTEDHLHRYQRYLFPAFVMLVYTPWFLERVSTLTVGTSLSSFCVTCREFSQTKDIDRPKEAHISVGYAKKVYEIIHSFGED